MTLAVIGLGSNVEPQHHLCCALDRMTERFGPLQLSPVYESQAIGFNGPAFLNLVAAFDTDHSVATIVAELRRIEREQGHPGNLPKFSSRTLDLDLLLHGDSCGAVDGIMLPREDITIYAYVLCPLADLLGECRHPRLGTAYSQLRRESNLQQQQLRRVPFHWRGRDLSASVESVVR